MSDYKEWANQKTWKILKAAEGADLDEGDTLTFMLDNSQPPKIHISSVTCNHSNRIQPHQGVLWTSACEGAEGKVAGKTNEAVGKAFEIVSDDKGNLSCNLIPSSKSPIINTAAVGAPCWTATDG
jgi:hypothetical protein